MAIVDITSLSRKMYYGGDDVSESELQKKHIEDAIRTVEKLAVKYKLICHTPKIQNGHLQMGLDL
jgi:hypothetical protein